MIKDYESLIAIKLREIIISKELCVTHNTGEKEYDIGDAIYLDKQKTIKAEIEKSFCVSFCIDEDDKEDDKEDLINFGVSQIANNIDNYILDKYTLARCTNKKLHLFMPKMKKYDLYDLEIINFDHIVRISHRGIWVKVCSKNEEDKKEIKIYCLLGCLVD